MSLNYFFFAKEEKFYRQTANETTKIEEKKKFEMKREKRRRKVSENPNKISLRLLFLVDDKIKFFGKTYGKFNSSKRQ